MEQHLEDAWAAARTRFDEFDHFVAESDRTAPKGDLGYALEQYSGWTLLAYAAHESAIGGYGRAVMGILGSAAATPDELPAAIRASHLKRTIAYANELTGVKPARRGDKVDPEDLLRRAYTSEWAADSVLMRLDRNAWPTNIRDWLERVGVAGEQLRWMRDPFGDGSDTLESLVAELVEERNDLAHGVRPISVKSGDAMAAWSSAVREFSRRIAGVLQVALATSLAIELEPVGVTGDVELGPDTAAIAELRVRIRVGGHLLCRDEHEVLHCARITSMQSDGQDVAVAEPGTKRVAVGLNRTVASLELLAPL